MVAQTYSGFAQRYNTIIGVLISALLTNLLFLIIPFGFFFMADIFLVVGSCIGLFFTFRYRKDSQSPIKTGIIVGLTGSVLSLLLISCFDWIFYLIPVYGIDFILFLQYTLYLLTGYAILYVLVGIIVGYLFGNYYKKREYVKIPQIKPIKSQLPPPIVKKLEKPKKIELPKQLVEIPQIKPIISQLPPPIVKKLEKPKKIEPTKLSCKFCGLKLKKDAKICPQCGKTNK